MSHSLEDRFRLAWPPPLWGDVAVVVAVSGGVDSVAVLRLLVATKHAGPGRLIVAHLDHALRGEESQADAQFVQRLGAELGLEVVADRVDVPALAAATSQGIEAAARHARYRFLEAAAGRAGARYIVTAHTADDQAETVLHRILRGTGVGGLAGIPRTRVLGPATVLRPLLGIWRRELVEYLEHLGQAFRIDHSNTDTSFTRNRLRHELLPLLARDYNPAIAAVLERLARHAGELQESLAPQIDRLLGETIEPTPDGVRIHAPLLAAAGRYLIREVLAALWSTQPWPADEMRHAHWDRLVELIACESDGATRSTTLPGRLDARREGKWLVVKALP